MKWHKVEDYPIGSNEYVLVSQYYQGSRIPYNCFVGELREDGMWALSVDDIIEMEPTDRWSYITLPEE